MADKEFNLVGVLKANTRDFERGIDKSKGKVGQFNRSQKQAADKARNIRKSLMGVAGSFGAVFGGAALAIGTFKGVIEGSQAAGDKWTTAVDGMKGGLDAFYRTLGTGDWDNLIDNMIRGKETAEELSKVLDDLFEGGLSKDIRIANIDKELAELDKDLRIAKQNQNWERVVTISYQIDQKSQEKLDVITVEAQRKYDAFKNKVNSDLGFKDDQLVNFIESYRDNADLMKDAASYMDELEKYQFNVKRFDQGIFTDKDKLAEAEQELQDFINETPEGVRMMAEMMQKYQGSTDDMMQKLVQSYIALTAAQTQNISATKKAAGDRARALRMLEDENVEIERKVENLDKLQSKGVSSVGTVDTNGINTTTLKPMRTYTPDPEDTEELENSLVGIEGLTDNLSYAFTNLFDDVNNGFDLMGNAVKNFASVVIQQLVSKGILMLLSSIFTGGVGGIVGGGIIKGGLFSLPKFATGGIVPGSSTLGDNVLAKVNSGEMILNDKQQASLFKMLDKGGSNGVSGDVRFEIAGDKLIGVLNNHQKRQNSYR